MNIKVNTNKRERLTTLTLPPEQAELLLAFAVEHSRLLMTTYASEDAGEQEFLRTVYRLHFTSITQAWHQVSSQDF